jgi:hypothetical protein
VSDVKIFTLEEAERSLPLVRRILADLKREYAAWKAAVARHELLAAGSPVESEAATAAEREASASAVRITTFLEELEALGGIFKGFDTGLVDFYALKDDRLVFLCWQLGEEHIAHWHEIDAGYAGRKPIEKAAFSGVVP